MAACPTHPDQESVGACTRCGRFCCAQELILVDAQAYCGDCGVRPDVDWLGHHYRQLEGKRSGMSWVLVLVAVPALVLGLVLLASPTSAWNERAVGAAFGVFGLSCVASASGRRGLHLAVLAGAVVATAGFGVFGSNDVVGFLFGVPGLILAVATWRDVPTRLYYRKPVPRAELRKHFEAGGHNPLAVAASRLAFLGLFVPGLGLLALTLGLMALTRVDSKKVPPVGGVRIALGAVLFSLMTQCFWLTALPSFMSPR